MVLKTIDIGELFGEDGKNLKALHGSEVEALQHNNKMDKRKKKNDDISMFARGSKTYFDLSP